MLRYIDSFEQVSEGYINITMYKENCFNFNLVNVHFNLL